MGYIAHPIGYISQLRHEFTKKAIKAALKLCVHACNMLQVHLNELECREKVNFF